MEPEKNFDDEEVKTALARDTHDGPGFETEDELPDSDFDGDAAEDDEAYTEIERDLVKDPEDEK